MPESAAHAAPSSHSSASSPLPSETVHTSLPSPSNSSSHAALSLSSPSLKPAASASVERRRSYPHGYATGTHLNRVFAALEALQPQGPTPTSTATCLTTSCVPSTDSLEGVRTRLPSSPAPLGLRGGAAAWMCSRLDVLWDSTTERVALSTGSSVSFATASEDENDEKSNEEARAVHTGGFPFVSPSWPSFTAAPHTATTSQRNGGIRATQRTARDIEGEAKDECMDGAADPVLSVARVRSRLILQLLALGVLRKRGCRKRDRRHTAITPAEKRQNADVPDVHPAGPSLLVREWLWQHAAALPERMDRVVSSSPGLFAGGLNLLLVEWASMGFSESEDEQHFSESTSTMHGSSAAPETHSLVEIEDLVKKEEEEEQEGEAEKKQDALYPPSPLPNEMAATHQGDVMAEEGMNEEPAREAPVGVGLVTDAAPPTAPQADTVDSVSLSAHQADAYAANSTSFISEPTPAKAPAPRVLRLVVRPPLVKAEPEDDALLLRPYAPATMGEMATDGSAARTTSAKETRETPLQGPSEMIADAIEIANSDNSTSSGRNIRVAGSVAGETRRFAIQLFRRITPTALTTTLQKEDADTATVPPPLPLPLHTVSTKDERGIHGEDTTAFLPAKLDVNEEKEEKANAATKAAVQGTADTHQQARWRRIAPFVLYAPPGSRAEADVRVVLRALGFGLRRCQAASTSSTNTAQRGAEASPLAVDAHFSPTFIQKERRFAVGASGPPCPLGRLPPLVAAYAWVHVAPLRAAWMSHIVRPCRLAASPCGAGGALSRTHTLNALSLLQKASRSCLVERCRRRFVFPCVAYADIRVSAMLDELCGVPLSITEPAVKDEDHAGEVTGNVTTFFHLSAAFEQDLHAYLCYPLAGGVSPHLEVRTAPDVEGTESDRIPLTQPAWEMYLRLRYGSRARRRSGRADGLRAGTHRNAEGDREERRRGGNSSSPNARHRRDCSTNESSSHPISRAAAAMVARCYKARCSPVYTASMDLAAVLLVAELRRACADAVKAQGSRFGGSRAAANMGKVELKECHECHAQRAATQVREDVVEGENVARVTHGRGQATEALGATKATKAVRIASPEALQDAAAFSISSLRRDALQAVLEGSVEVDVSLCCYVHQLLHPSPTSLSSTSTPKRCPYRRCSCFTSHRKGDGAEAVAAQSASSDPHAADEISPAPLNDHDASSLPSASAIPTSNTPPLMYAATLWLSLVAVLSIGESAIAQYVRSALLPPVEADKSPSSSTSAAPLTMPSLFQATLEDLYKEEAALRLRRATPLCHPQACAEGRIECTKSHARPTSGSEAEDVMAKDSVALAAAVALRHPRVLLRHAHALWRLCGEDVSTTAAVGEMDKKVATVPRQQNAVEGLQGHRTDDSARAAPLDFTARVSGLLECVQLGTCAGLPAPLAASLVPAVLPGSHVNGPSHSTSAIIAAAAAPAASKPFASGSTSMGKDGADTAVAPAKADAHLARKGEHPALLSLSSLGDSEAVATSLPSAVHVNAAPDFSSVTSPPARPRLQLRLSSTSSSSFPMSTAAMLPDASSATSRKRRRTPPLTTERTAEAAGLSLKVEKQSDHEECSSVQAPHRLTTCPSELPPLDGLTDLRVRYGGFASTAEAAASSITSSSSGPASSSMEMPLLQLVSNVLWCAMQHLHTFHPKELPLPSPSCVLPTAGVLGSVINRGNTREGSTASVLAQRPLRRTLMLRLAPAFVQLQRLWQALRPAAPHCGLKEKTRGDGCASASGCLRGVRDGPVLEVALPSPSSPSSTTVASATPSETAGERGVSHADLRHYSTLTATVRGVVCVVLGYAVYAVLSRIWESFVDRCGLKKDESAGVAEAVPRASSPVSSPSTHPPLHSSFNNMGEVPCDAAREGATASPDASSLAWLTAQLRTYHDEVLQPLQRVCTAYTDSTESGAQPSLTTVAWLSYPPLSRVLFPCLLRGVDEALVPPTPPDERTAALGESDEGRVARAVWLSVRATLQQAGVLLPSNVPKT